MSLKELREDILRGCLDVQARLNDPANDCLPNIASVRARAARGVEVARDKLKAAS